MSFLLVLMPWTGRVEMVFFQLFGCEALLQEIFMGIDRSEKKETVAFTVCIVKVLLAAQKML